MPAKIIKLDIVTAEYCGPNRRLANERRWGLDRRRMIRFDANGGDRRSGFSRRHSDEGIHELDYC